jgi:hypothetical protein
MIECDIKGCSASESELVSPNREILKRWVILRACLCGAYDTRTPKMCSCHSDSLVPTSFWPNLDWWALGGVDKIILCPDHKVLVMHEIERQRGLDPSMDAAAILMRQNPTNRH